MAAEFDTLLELLDSSGNLLEASDLFGDVYHSQISDFQLPSSDTYAITTRGYASGETGTYTLSVDGITRFAFASDEADVSEAQAATAFVVQYADERTEVWDIAERKALSTFSNNSAVTFSPDPNNSIFVAEDTSGLLEVHRTADGARLTREVTDIFYSPDAEATYFIVTYADSPGGEIFDTSSGKLLATLEDEKIADVTFSSDENGTYFVVEYPGDRNEVWLLQDEPPHSITDLGSNVTNHLFDVSNQRLVVRYKDNQVYLLNLEMLEALSEELPAEDLLREACEYLFSSGTFDEAELREYLEENEPEACPEEAS